MSLDRLKAKVSEFVTHDYQHQGPTPFEAFLKPLAKDPAWELRRFRFKSYGIKSLPQTAESEYGPSSYTPDVDLGLRSGFQLCRMSSLDVLMADLKVPEGHELCLCSDVYDSGMNLLGHLPILDLDCETIPDAADVVHRVLKATDSGFLANAFNFMYFASGRSFHAYPQTPSVGLLALDKFLGTALLVGTPGHPFVDTHWVGHAILRGHAALRLTRINPGRYKAIPALV